MASISSKLHDDLKDVQSFLEEAHSKLLDIVYVHKVPEWDIKLMGPFMTMNAAVYQACLIMEDMLKEKD